MKSIRYGNGSYRVEAILKHTRDEYVANNPGGLFKGMPEANAKAKLGELWDMARAAVPVEPETPNGKGGKGKDKPKTDPIPPTE